MRGRGEALRWIVSMTKIDLTPGQLYALVVAVLLDQPGSRS